MAIVTSTETLLPDPEPRTIRYTIISVDDHLVEPPDMFEGRVAAEYADRVSMVRELAPHIAVASDFIVGFPGETEADF